MKSKIAFILDHNLMHYRVAFFNKLSMKGYDITVFHSGEFIEQEGINFKQVKTYKKSFFKVLDYRQIDNNLTSFEIIVCMQNIRLINLWWLTFNPMRKNKIIHWGIGASSRKGLGSQSNIIKFIRNILVSKADAVVYYSPFPLRYVKEKHFNKVFIALNTVYNPNSTDLSKNEKDSFLFIGSLNRRKGLMSLVMSFKLYLLNCNPKNIKNLVIIGSGEEYDKISEFINDNNLKKNIHLLGKIDSFYDKLPYFKKSIATVSLRQAGLSVLESFSYGLPFIALKNAISGGEHLNIVNNENGFLLESENDLVSCFNWFDQHTEKAEILGKNSFDFYTNKANMDAMVQSFYKAIKYV